MMSLIPIVFSIDNNVIVPCGVAITSLLLNAHSDTFYSIYILYSETKLSEIGKQSISNTFKNNPKCEVCFIEIGDELKGIEDLPSGHITSATYYRLLIPDLFPQYEKVIYADVDMIFQQDLSDVYQKSLLHGELIAAVLDLAITDDFVFHSDLPARIGKSEKDYFNAGFLVMNLALMRKEGIVRLFKEHSQIKYEQNDQDVLNIVCNRRVQFLPTLYNFQLNHFSNYMWGRKDISFSFDELFKKATLHYTWKHKPWNSLECVGFDTWWHYFKMSSFYDDKVYFQRQYEQIEACRNDYHRLSNRLLFKRILINLKHRVLG